VSSRTSATGSPTLSARSRSTMPPRMAKPMKRLEKTQIQ
jgi:hypothetical protein